jgi:hypothetical protein
LRCAVTVAGVVAVSLAAVPAAAQSSKSAPLAAEFAQILEQRKLQNFAVKDPDHPGFYVAASHTPGLHLLVVRARSSSPEYADYVLSASKYDEVYNTLNGASAPEGKLFVQDMACNGLSARPKDGQPLDIVYRDVVKMTIFNGDWKKQKMNEREYGQAFDEADAEYARVLSLLLQKLKVPARP